MKNTVYGIHWFRRDLRIEGNPALHWLSNEMQGAVLGIFFIDQSFLKRDDFSWNRFTFFLNTLKELKNSMKKNGGDLLVLDQPPLQGFQALTDALTAKPRFITFCRDYEPFARKRDEKVYDLLNKNLGIQTKSFQDHLIIEPTKATKDDGTFYKVYTPFFNKWKDQFLNLNDSSETFALPQRFSIKWSDTKTKLHDCLDEYLKKAEEKCTIHLPEAGHSAAVKKLENFSDKVDAYLEQRDFPAEKGTSKLSIYFKNGSLTTAQVIKFLNLKNSKTLQNKNHLQYLKEIAWREFYYSILYHCPRVETEAFIEKYKNIEWQNNEKLFKAWKDGMTGYPIVDAGMRELKTTGLMHNRVRMIVASFLTKDLLIDWRWGEKYFMDQLLDGDLAPNNGGWQWAASTGCDPQPYFRIFNPELQSEKFDPQGEYIKKYVPELKNVSAKEIHAPTNYIEPVVVHAKQKMKALALYK